MRLKKLFIAGAVALTVGVTSLCAYAGTNESPKREMRSTWFTTYMRIDWPSTTGTTAAVQNKQKQELINYLDNFDKRHLNGICFQVRSIADAMYESSYEPWSAAISGTRGKDPGWDPLAFAIEECHKRGIECYAWINPFRQRRTQNNYTTEFDKKWASDGLLLTYNTADTYYTVFNPAVPAAREHCLKVIKEIYTKYPIDGMLFDDYFYPNNIPENSSAADYNLYKNSGSSLSFGDWRRENINSFMRELEAQVTVDRPDLRFGVSPAGVAYLGAYKYGFSKPKVSTTDWQYNTIYSDPIAWLADGSIDFVSPQLYWPTSHSTAPFGPLSEWWSDVAHHFGRHFYGSLGPYRMGDGGLQNNTSGWADLVQQINYTRQYNGDNAPGQIYYSSKYFDGPSLSGFGQYMQDNAYQRRALTPVVAWKEHPNYNAPSNLTRSGSKLTWNAVQGARDNSIIRYTVYAVPKDLSIEDALSPDGDGIDIKYFLNVSYSTSFNTGITNPENYWYAVCVYDGYGNEHPAAYSDYPMVVGEATTLVSPKDGATVDWNCTFTWTKVDNAVYLLKIASDDKFNNVVAEINDITSTSYTFDLEGMTPGARMYWTVTTIQPKSIPVVSEPSSFIVPQYLNGIATTLISPSNGTELTGDMTFTWSSVAPDATYKIQISPVDDFSNIRHEETVQGTSVTIASTLLGRGNWFWRVISSIPHHNDAISGSHSFFINTIEVGTFEPGYQIIKDPAAYESTETLSIENMWVRSVKAPYNNIKFQNTGSFNRGLAVDKQYVYLSGRVENSQNSDIYISRYSLFTGEHINDIILSENGKMGYYPCNDVFTDNAGNLLIANLSLAGTSRIVVQLVDTETGNLTDVAEIHPNVRVDHVAVWGDVKSTTEPFYVMCVGASNTVLFRYKVEPNGDVTGTETYANVFYPDWANNFGIAPRVHPISDRLAYIDGGSTYFTLYDFVTGKKIDSFDSNDTIQPIGASANGGCVFTAGKHHLAAYAYSDYINDEGHSFGVVTSGTNDMTFANVQKMWVVPRNGIGKENSTTMSAPVASIDMGDNTAYLAVYSAGNGIAVYKFTDHSVLLGDVNKDGTISISDVVMACNYALNNLYDAVGDLDYDKRISVSDIVMIVNLILSAKN